MAIFRNPWPAARQAFPPYATLSAAADYEDDIEAFTGNPDMK